MSICRLGSGGGITVGWGGWVAALVGVGWGGWASWRVACEGALTSGDGSADGRSFGVGFLVGGGRYSGPSMLLADSPLLLP